MPAAVPLSGTENKEHLCRAMQVFARRRFVENAFISGHCFIESVAQSNPLTLGVRPRHGAPLLRRALAFAYRDPNIQENISQPHHTVTNH